MRTDLVPLHSKPVELAIAFNWEALHSASQESFEAMHCDWRKTLV